jgi:predicted phage terminase large subunit-like protein
MHRWHDKDLPGRLLAQMADGGEPWEYWRIPAIAEPDDVLGRPVGAPLWTERYPLSELAAIRSGMTSSMWRSLYGQDPRPGSGVMFKREWFKIVPTAPTGASWCRAWDFAGSDDLPTATNEDACWTAGVRVGRFRGEWWIADSRRRRAIGKPIEDLLKETAKEDRAVCGGSIKIRGEVEPGGMARQWLDHLAREVLCGFDFLGEPARESKTRRAEPLAAAAENGHVHLVAGPWVKDFLDEIEGFPDAKIKDQVDAASLGMNELADSDNPSVM